MNAIILTAEELQQKINEAVEKALPKVHIENVKRKKGLDVNEAIEYLNEIGYKCSYSQISKLAMQNAIPLEKFGRRNTFNAADLEKWVGTKIQKRVDISGNVSRSANFKLR